MGHSKSPKSLSLAKLFKTKDSVKNSSKTSHKLSSEKAEEDIKKLQLDMLRIQQGVWHQKARVIIAFEGFDAAGKGGAIRRLVEPLDPRGFVVHAIGAPEAEERGQQFLYRFWKRLPPPGHIAVFDRTWYGRVLVEKVDRLTPKHRVHEAYKEIREFESMLLADGILMVKIFLAIDKKEQSRRFEDRLSDPYKQWKLTPDDVKARGSWNQYVDATEEMFEKTSTKESPWHLVPANDKDYARVEVLKIVTKQLAEHRRWMEQQSLQHNQTKNLKLALKELAEKKGPRA